MFNNLLQGENSFSILSSLLNTMTASSLAGYANRDFYKNSKMQPTASPILANGAIIKNGGQYEVEGGEVKESPNGAVQEFQGASHAQGGIKTQLNPNDIVFSDRLKINGMTLADRKKKRLKLEMLLKKRLNDSRSKVDQNTFDRTKQALDLEQQSDLMYQKSQETGGKKLYNGTSPNINPDQWVLDGMPQAGMQQLPTLGVNNFMLNNPLTPQIQLNPSSYDSPKLQSTVQASAGVPQLPQEFLDQNKRSLEAQQILSQKDTPDYQNSLGDNIGQAGVLFNGIAPLMNTLMNRGSDTPNINAYKDFGNKALQNNTDIGMMLNQQRDLQFNDIALGENAARNRINNNSRSMSTLNALNAVTDNQVTNQRNKANAGFTNSMLNVLNGRTSLLQARDSAVMGGEQRRDLADRQDKDNFSTQLGRNLQNLGQQAQQYGANMNQQLLNKDMLGLLNSRNDYGYKVTKNGTIPTYKGKAITDYSTAEMDKIYNTLDADMKEIFNMYWDSSKKQYKNKTKTTR